MQTNPALGQKALRNMLHRPLAFHWSLQRPHPPDVVRSKPALEQPIQQLPRLGGQSNLCTLAKYLSGHQVRVSCVTFEFKAEHTQWKTGGPSSLYPNAQPTPIVISEALTIGITVLRDAWFRENLVPWQKPWDERTEYPPCGGYNGQYLLGKEFSSATHEGLGWVEIEPQKTNPGFPDDTHLSIGETQEDAYFRAEAIRQRSTRRTAIDLLRIWRHLIIAALEDLAPQVGFTTLSGVSIGSCPVFRHSFEYDGIFKKRQGSNGEPLYQRIPFPALPGRRRTDFVFDNGDTVMTPGHYWVYPPQTVNPLAASDIATAHQQLQEAIERAYLGVKRIIIFD